MNERVKLEAAQIIEGGSDATLPDHSPVLVKNKDSPKINASPLNQISEYAMNLNMISRARNQKTTIKLAEASDKDITRGAGSDRNNLQKISKVGQNSTSIDHTIFLEAQVKNLREPLADVTTQIEQETIAVDSLKLRRNRVKRLVLSMLKTLARYPIDAL